jgi:ribosomal protein L7Ae-like RNA K-turn-binding protein
VDVLGKEGADLIRLVLGPGGEIAVDSGSRHGGGFGRGAHLHARRACVERAARSGLLRATKGKAHLVTMGPQAGEGEKPEALSTDSLARAIQRSMDRRIEGLLVAAVRSRRVARGADAVTGACQRGEAELVLVACDAAAAADLTEVRRAVAEGRAVAWGTKARLGAIVAPLAVRGKLPSLPAVTMGAPEGVGVVAIASRTIAEALRRAVQAANAVTATVGHDGGSPGRGTRRVRDRRSDG